MAGGGGGGTFYRRTPEELQKQIRKAEESTTVAGFEARLSDTLGSLLAEYNGRDQDLTRQRLAAIKTGLQGEMDGSFDQLFGGSVAKYTHVEGMSDIDCLVLIDDSELEGKAPDAVLRKLESVIRRSAGVDAQSVSHGRMAVTVTYADGMMIQVLPALRGPGNHLHVPSSRTQGDWSKINPLTFQAALTRRNQECGNKLVPTIKLAKAINGNLPESQRLSGYHMESLGISAFRGYDGQKTTAAMLPYYFERAKQLVLAPIKDKTGQSIHVDDYMGQTNSPQRVAISHVLDRIAKRMRNASAGQSSAQWLALFGINS